jgi:hypothetical protein
MVIDRLLMALCSGESVVVGGLVFFMTFGLFSDSGLFDPQAVRASAAIPVAAHFFKAFPRR